MVYEAIRELVRYGLEKGLITEDDAIYARNQILEVLKMDEYEEPEKDGGTYRRSSGEDPGCT